jgi:tudor domain-containing protein 3
MSSDDLLDVVKSCRASILAEYGLKLNDEGLQRLAASCHLLRITPRDAKTALPALLDTNLDGAGEVASLERNLGSLQAAAVAGPVMVQIMTVRDMTQPLRPCADMLEGEEVWSAANHRNSDKRLLKLTVTDGAVTVAAVELSTLKVFKRIPVPGEKLLLRGADVQAGMVMLTDECVTVMGGAVQSLKNEFLLSRDKIVGAAGAPRFEPFRAGASYNTASPAQTTEPSARVQESGRGGGYRGGGSDRGGHRDDHGRGHGAGRGHHGESGRGHGGGGGGRGHHSDGGGRGRGARQHDDSGHRGRGSSRGGRGGGDRHEERHDRGGRGGAYGGFSHDATPAASAPRPAAPPPPPTRANLTKTTFDTLFPAL